jgi:serine/threonine-protein kinase
VTGLNARGPFHGMRDLVPVYFWFYFALWLALFCAYQIEAGDRRAFLQGRAFEKERARADVAERSRAMSEALLRMAGAPRVPTRVQPGDVIDSRYRVIQLLGAGGMGQVHEVERTIDGRRLALKILTGPTDREALLRFAREAQVAAEIVHPNVVSVFDVGVAQSGMFLVMELVAGSALSANKDRYGDAAWARPILKQVASALSAMHARGIVHRDLKPANVLLDGDRAKVADFGIASLGEPGGSDSTVTKGAPLTEAGVIMGTPLYMAPELEHGARGATPPADLYSLGVMAYELLSRKLPHATAPVLERLAGRVPPKAPSLGEARPDLPAPLIALIDRCLAFSPEARPTAAEVSEAL